MSHPTLEQALAGGPQAAPALMQALQVSQPTLSRLVRERAGQVLRFGRARATRYALKRPVRGLGSQWPVYRVDEAAQSRLAGRLSAIHPRQFVWHDVSGHDSVHDSLPWFLWDMRPQGFLGRAYSGVYDKLALPARLQDWDEDDVLQCLLNFGFTQPSNWLVGDGSRQKFEDVRRSLLDMPESEFVLDRQEAHGLYPAEALRIINQQSGHSSAGGEQPKFGLWVREQGRLLELLVKFSPPVSLPNGQRWSDLLVAEHLALLTLAGQGITVAQSAVVHEGGRTFLEVVRFDRSACLGRRGMVSLEAVSDEFVGHHRPWDEQAQALRALRKISAADFEAIVRIFAFGLLIANEDMHNGNLSFYLADDLGLTLAPVYDMLPMRYAPTGQGEVVARGPRRVSPTPLTAPVWADVLPWAQAYWLRVSQDRRVSPEFQAIARQQLQALAD